MHVIFPHWEVRYDSFPNWGQKFCFLFSDASRTFVKQEIVQNKKLIRFSISQNGVCFRSCPLTFSSKGARMRKFSNPSWCEWIRLLLISLSIKIDNSQVLLNLHLTFNSNVFTPTQCSETALSQVNFLFLLLKPLRHLRHLADANIVCYLLGYWKTISIFALVKFSGKSAHICLLKRWRTEI